MEFGYVFQKKSGTFISTPQNYRLLPKNKSFFQKSNLISNIYLSVDLMLGPSRFYS